MRIFRRSDPQKGQKALLTVQQLNEAAEDVASRSLGAGVSIAAAGGYAMQIYGSDRLTVDLDVVASRMIPGMPKLSKLSFGGYASKMKVPVDVIVRSDRYKNLYREALKMASWAKRSPIRVIRVQHLAAMKMVAGRAKDDMDLDFLLVTMSPSERSETRKVVNRHLGVYAVDELENRILEAEWKRSRGKI